MEYECRKNRFEPFSYSKIDHLRERFESPLLSTDSEDKNQYCKLVIYMGENFDADLSHKLELKRKFKFKRRVGVKRKFKTPEN